MKRPIVRLTGVKAGGGRERACQRRPKNTFSFTLSVLFLPVLSSGLWPASASLADCTALLTPTDPLFLFSEMASQTSTHCGGSGGGREGGRTEDGRRHPHLSHSSHRHSFTLHNSKEEGTKRERGRASERGTEGDSRSFPTFALSPFLPSLSLAACPRLMPAAAAEGRSSFGRARTYRQASALRSAAARDLWDESREL